MTLREKQSLFVLLIGKFIDHAYALGYELTFGETYRTPAQAIAMAKAGKGIRNSLHVNRLAVDFNLFKDGHYCPYTEQWRPLGEYWESLHELARWGGRFGDGNHLSLEHEGRK